MGRKGVTREAVATVHDALVAAGLTPSVRAVRERLGDTGSLTTIAEHLRAIHAERQDASGPSLPDPIVRKLLEGASSFWRELSEAADRAVDDVRATAAADVAAALAERDQARALAARAQEELESRRGALDALERHLAETSARLERAERDLAAADEARAMAEDAARVRGDERDAARRDLATARADAARREREREEERSTARSRVEALEHEIADARLEHGEERDALIARLTARDARDEEREGRHAEIASALARAEERERSLGDTLDERERERDAARDEATALRERLRSVAAERDALDAERAASARDAGTAALLERLLADDRTGRVLALLESIDARVGGPPGDPVV